MENNNHNGHSHKLQIPSVESDYPELSSDFTLKTVSSTNLNTLNTLNAPGSMLSVSPLNKSQIISRRLKLDLRNESDVAIAGIRNWNRYSLQSFSMSYKNFAKIEPYFAA